MQAVCASSIHPDTQQLIHKLFRTNMFAWINTPIIMGLSTLPQAGLIPYLAQVLNQS